MKTIALLSIAVLVCGCTPNAPYRTDLSANPDPKKAAILSTADYKLGIIEFDDQGWFWLCNKQREAVEDMVRSEAAIGTHTPHAILLVTFVHGWKNNAAPDNGGLKAFENILQSLSHAEQLNAHPRRVVGVYVAWRGLSATIEPFKELSFYSRKETAHKVGGYGGLTELLTELEIIQHLSLVDLQRYAPDQPKTELIIIGHSFGAAAVFSAIGQILTERFVYTFATTDKHPLKPLGDQIILLNPAFEAERYYDLQQLAQTVDKFPANQRPVLTIFTSKGDWATHYFFPLGRFFANLAQRNRDDFQKSANLQAVGWFEPFITHHLCYVGPRPTTRPAGTKSFSLDPQFLQESHANIADQRAKWLQANQPQRFDETVLTPTKDAKPRLPFLVVTVDPRIMADHTDITNCKLINFIREYVDFCDTQPTAAASPGALPTTQP